MLALSGKLNLSRPGQHPFPPMDRWTWTQHNPFKEIYPSDHRSVYLMTQRLQRHPYLALFDGPDTNTSTEQRTSATVPQQALFLMNSPFVRAQAEGFAGKLMRATSDPRRRVQLAYELAFSRTAKPIEVKKGVWYIDEYERQLAQIGVSKERWQQEAWTSFARIMLSANEFVYVD